MADECGQDLIEYALLCGFITLGVVLATTNLGGAVNRIFAGISTDVASVPAPYSAFHDRVAAEYPQCRK